MRLRPLAPAVLLLAGCAQAPERVILLPDAAGHSGALVVRSGATQVELATPYAAAEVREGTAAPARSDAQDVDTRYGELLKVPALRSRSWVLYFRYGTTDLTAESAQHFPHIVAAVGEAPGARVDIAGHADRVGSDVYNDALSAQRARSVRDRLLAAGLASETIRTQALGERAPAVPTADGVAEPRNRRVEIRVY